MLFASDPSKKNRSFCIYTKPTASSGPNAALVRNVTFQSLGDQPLPPCFQGARCRPFKRQGLLHGCLFHSNGGRSSQKCKTSR
jgi:hypothetical protein